VAVYVLLLVAAWSVKCAAVRIGISVESVDGYACT